MITNIAIVTSKMELDEAIKQYVNKKIGRLDRFLPRHARQSVHANAILRQVNRAHGNKYECEVVLHVPDQQLTATDSTLNIFAAIDIVEEKLKNQLKRYKATRQQASLGGRHGILRRIKLRLARGESL